MSKKNIQSALPNVPSAASDRNAEGDYRTTIHGLQVELVKLQKHLISCNDKILVLIEGRDTAGKDGVIKRIVRHLSPRETRVVALGKPSDRERGGWYFERYVPHLPSQQEFVLFNRSWYNRAGVERVMGFCTEDQYEEFMQTVLEFEHMLVKSGIKLFKYYLDISRAEQKRRLKDRRDDPLKQWKISPIDSKAIENWAAYSQARNEMFARTHNPVTPWTIVRADDKHLARTNLIKDLLVRLHYDDKDNSALLVNPDIVLQYHDTYAKSGVLAP
ncbi:polyphosphate kinase 2 [Martelella sp. AMO21009]